MRTITPLRYPCIRRSEVTIPYLLMSITWHSGLTLRYEKDANREIRIDPSKANHEFVSPPTHTHAQSNSLFRSLSLSAVSFAVWPTSAWGFRQHGVGVGFGSIPQGLAGMRAEGMIVASLRRCNCFSSEV